MSSLSKSRKSQAIESIAVFASILLIIAITVGVLTVGKIFSPREYIEPSCDLSPRVKCLDVKINTTGHGSALIENKFGEDLANLRAKFGNCDEGSMPLLKYLDKDYIFFNNCGEFSEGQFLDERITLKYQILGSSLDFLLGGNLITRVESGIVGFAKQVIINIIKDRLIAAECTYLKYDITPSSNSLLVQWDSIYIWKPGTNLYIGGETVTIDCIIPPLSCGEGPSCSGCNPFGDAQISLSPSLVNGYMEGSPLGLLSCCPLEISPTRGSVKSIETFDIQDTYISESSPGLEYNGDTSIKIEKNIGTNKVALFKFTISSLPANAYIIDAKLMLTTNDAVDGGQLSIHNSRTRWANSIFFAVPSWTKPTSSGTWINGLWDSSELNPEVIASFNDPIALDSSFNISSQVLTNYLDDTNKMSPRPSTINFTIIQDIDGKIASFYSNDGPAGKKPKLFVFYQESSGPLSLCPPATTTTSIIPSPPYPPPLPLNNYPITLEYTSIQQKPAIEGNIIVWQNFTNYNFSLHACDLNRNGIFGGCYTQDKKLLIGSSAASLSSTAVSGNKIVWLDDYDGQIYMCDLSANTEGCSSITRQLISTGARVKSNPKIYSTGTGTKVVWQELIPPSTRDLFICDFDSATSIAECGVGSTQLIIPGPNPPSIISGANPDIYGNYIVFESSNGFLTDVSLCVLSSSGCSSISQLTSGGTYLNPRIYNDYVVYELWNGDTRQLRGCNIVGAACSGTDFISLFPSDDRNPAISDSYIVWDRLSGTGKRDIYMCDRTKTGTDGGCAFGDLKTQLTTDTAHQILPDIGFRPDPPGDSNGRLYVVWTDYRYASADIYTSQFVP